MKIKALLGIAVASIALCACSEEDEVQPLYHDPSVFFMPEEGATDPTSALRREFQQKYGSYLLFNDTIQYYYAGRDISGNDVYQWETVELDYAVGKHSTDNQYTFTYINDYEKQKEMTKYLEEYIVPHCQGKMKPFSWFLCNTITGKTVAGRPNQPYVVSGQRCTGVACNYLLQRERNETQKVQYSQKILVGLVATLATNFSQYFTQFFEYSGGYYNQNVNASTAEERTDKMKKHGFITLYMNVYYPSRETDLESFAQATINYTEEEFVKNNSKYPLVIEKYRFVKRTLESLGFVY